MHNGTTRLQYIGTILSTKAQAICKLSSMFLGRLDHCVWINWILLCELVNSNLETDKKQIFIVKFFSSAVEQSLNFHAVSLFLQRDKWQLWKMAASFTSPHCLDKMTTQNTVGE